LEKVKANLRAQEEPKSLPSDAFPWLQICQNCFCDRGSAPDPAGGAYSASPDPLAGLKGPTSKGRWREGERKERKGRGREGKGREKLRPLSQIPGSARDTDSRIFAKSIDEVPVEQ